MITYQYRFIFIPYHKCYELILEKFYNETEYLHIYEYYVEYNVQDVLFQIFDMSSTLYGVTHHARSCNNYAMPRKTVSRPVIFILVFCHYVVLG